MQSERKEPPYVPPELVTFLQEKYPLRDYRKATPENLKFLHGVHEVIDFLNLVVENQASAGQYVLGRDPSKVR